MRATLKVLMGVSRPILYYTILYYLLSTYSFVLFFIWQINTFLFCSAAELFVSIFHSFQAGIAGAISSFK